MIRSFLFFIKLIFQQRHLILSMAKRDLMDEYIGSLLGFTWTFINPIIMIFIYWVVFSVGFKIQPTRGVPFVVWLTAGMAIWLLFSNILNASAGSVVASAQLIKKTVFPSQILPVIKIVSSVVTHGIFVAILIILILLLKMPFSFFFFQSLYYLLCMALLALGIGWTMAALNVFLRDIGQIVGVILQLGFWITPIFWDLKMMPREIQGILQLNPMYYIVQGYRDSFIYFVPFWHSPYLTLYFWGVTLMMLIAGATIFRKLKLHFADVL
jgi:ABC-type polysaccharide/polyol phosphate export permease